MGRCFDSGINSGSAREGQDLTIDTACEPVLRPRLHRFALLGLWNPKCYTTLHCPQRHKAIARPEAADETPEVSVVRPVQVTKQPAIVGIAFQNHGGGLLVSQLQLLWHFPKGSSRCVEAVRQNPQSPVGQTRSQAARQTCVLRV